MMRTKWILVIFGVLELAFVVGVVIRNRSHAKSVKIAPAPPAVVRTPLEIALTGIVQPANIVSVPVPVDGTIEEFLAAVGQHVSEGEVLARIRNPRLAAAERTAQLDAEQARNRLQQLEAGLIAARLEVSRSMADATRIQSELDKAEKAFERQQTMFREGVTPRLAYEKAEREYNALKAEASKQAENARKAPELVNSITAQLDPARKEVAQKSSDLEDAQAESAVGEVNSPTDGVVTARRGKQGEQVTPATPDLFQIAADPQALEVVAPNRSEDCDSCRATSRNPSGRCPQAR